VWGRPLKKTFPKLFNIARDMDALVVDHMLVNNKEVDWDMNFIRLVHDWDVDVISSLFNALYSIRLGQGNENKLCWSPSKRRTFDIKAFYIVILPIVDFSFPWKNIWGSKVPLGVACSLGQCGVPYRLGMEIEICLYIYLHPS
jgi:hypothetical protein